MSDVRTIRTVAIIGAGMAGLSCANRLRAAGYAPQVFEALAEPGGRLSRAQKGHETWDDGAQFLTARSPVMQQQMRRWQQAGIAALWQPQMDDLPSDDWYVGVPTMTALTDALAQSLNVHVSVPVKALHAHQQQWRLQTSSPELTAPFDAVVLATAPAQAAQLLSMHAPDWSARLADVVMLPCWTVLLSTAAIECSREAGVLNEGPVSWWARDDSKPGRTQRPQRQRWVIQGSAGWSQQHIDATTQDVAHALLTHFRQNVLGLETLPDVQVSAVELWRAARRSPQPVWADHLWCTQRRLGVCGDGLSHSRIEQAYLSGYGLAEHILEFSPLTH